MKIAFTSCMNLAQVSEQEVWEDIEGENPDYLFLLGDQIYMDFWPHLGEPAQWDDARFEQEMRTRYEAQWSEPRFKALVERLRERQGKGGGVYGTWDDHDFAWNNANGRSVPAGKKTIAANLFCTFVQRQPAPADGIHQSVPLLDGGRTVGKAIFLDTRWHRDEPGDDNDLLGEAQFEFLRAEMNEPLALTIICAGTPQRATGKGWTQYRRDWQRFLEIVGQRHVIFLSGDIHENAFIPPASGTRLYEIVASGAAVKKFKLVGKRQNYGVLEWSAERTAVKLRDRRGSQSYTIFNDSFEFEEHEPAQD